VKQALTIIAFLLMLLTNLAAVGAQQTATPDVTQADVIVYGSTPGGFCAAIAAAGKGLP
jgi:hypothetical protein